MSRLLGVAAASVALAVSGCGGVSELDSEESNTVIQARSVVDAAVTDGTLTPAGEKTLEDLMVICHEKPLAESDGESMRNLMTEIAPRLKAADPQFSKRLRKFAAHGC